MYGVAGANRCGSDRRMDGERLEVAHNGVRGDNVVGVREARRVSSGITNQTREDVIMSVRSLIGIGLCALLSLLGGNSVFAQEPAPAPVSTSTVQERLDVLEKKSDAPGLWKTLGFQLSGGVSASYNHNFNNPNTNLSQLRTSDANTNTFTPNLAQLMLQRSADPGRQWRGSGGLSGAAQFWARCKGFAGTIEFPTWHGQHRAGFPRDVCRVHRPGRQRPDDSSGQDQHGTRV